jgi:hypothetical protein
VDDTTANAATNVKLKINLVMIENPFLRFGTTKLRLRIPRRSCRGMNGGLVRNPQLKMELTMRHADGN